MIYKMKAYEMMNHEVVSVILISILMLVVVLVMIKVISWRFKIKELVRLNNKMRTELIKLNKP